MSIRSALLAFACLSGVPAAALAAEPAPAQVREVLPAGVEPVSYDITVTPNAAALSFTGEARITFEVAQPTDRVVMNAADLAITGAALVGGGPARVSLEPAERVAFSFAAPLPAGRHTIAVQYSGKINETANGLFAGPYRTPAGEARAMLVTQFEPGDARRLAPMWDEPARKAVFNLTAIIPEGQSAVSNMPAVESRSAGPGLTRVTFAPSPKMSSYLLFLAVGQMDRLAGQSGAVELGVVAKAGDADKGALALSMTRELLPYFNEYFATPYPLPKLDQIAVPGAGGFGAMENWGAILYFEPYLLFDPALNGEADRQRIFAVVAHEVAHQWFGNLVTMSWWDDLWLNEGFASWMENKATDRLRPQWNPWLQALAGQEGAMELDARASTHPIVEPVATVAAANQAFNPITYQKGEAVIRMLEAYVGEEAFRAGVRAYMQRHAYANTVTDDLWSAIEAASRQPVRAIAADFTRQAGVPLITVEQISCQRGRSRVRLVQGRFGVDEASRTPTTWRVPVTARAVGGRETARAVISGAGSMTVPGCGPVVVNKDRTGYFRVAYDAASFEALSGAFARLDAADQLALLNDSWALGAAGQAPAARAFELAAKAPSDADPLVQRQIAGLLARVRGYYAGEPGAAAFGAFALGVLRPMFAQVGWEARAGEQPNVALLRSRLIVALAQFGDRDVIAEARRRLAASDADPAALPAAQRAAVLTAVGAGADAAQWELLAAKARGARSPLEQRQYLSALAAVADPALAQRTLDFLLTDATPKQLTPNLLNAVAAEHPDLAWRFYLAQRAAVDARLDPLQRLEFPAWLAAASSDAARIAELQGLAASLGPDGEKPIAEAVAAITQAAAVRRERLPEIDRWLAGRR